MKSGESKKTKKRKKMTPNERFYGQCRNNFCILQSFCLLIHVFSQVLIFPLYSLSPHGINVSCSSFLPPFSLSIPPSIPNFSPYLPLTRGQLAAAAAAVCCKCPLVSGQGRLCSSPLLQILKLSSCITEPSPPDDDTNTNTDTNTDTNAIMIQIQ